MVISAMRMMIRIMPARARPTSHQHSDSAPTAEATIARAPQQSRSQRSLERILTAAEEVLSEQGLDGFTLIAVSSRSGVSVGGIYRRFTDKQELLRAIKDRVLTRLENAIASHMARLPPRLEDVVQVFVRETSHHFRVNSRLFTAFFTPGANDYQMAERGSASMANIFGSFSVAALRDRECIAHKDPEMALRVAFDLVTAPVIRRTAPTGGNLPSTSLPWEAFTAELVRACLVYLTLNRPATNDAHLFPEEPT